MIGRAAAVGRDVPLEVDGHRLGGRLDEPPTPRGLVLFAHGSGSSRLSPRNQRVALTLHDRGLATYRFDLLDEDEAADRRLVFDIALLGRRLLAATDLVLREAGMARQPLGYFGASTGAAAALLAAAARDDIRAVVSRGGRPDLAGEALPRVHAPTLLIVGGADPLVLQLNQQALAMLAGEKELTVVPGATHLFEEPGAIERVAELAAAWFSDHLGAS